MSLALCPACGKLLCLEFPLHLCKKSKPGNKSKPGKKQKGCKP